MRFFIRTVLGFFILFGLFFTDAKMQTDTILSGDKLTILDTLRNPEEFLPAADTIRLVDTLIKIDTIITSGHNFVRGEANDFAPVMLDGDTLFNLYAYIGPYSPRDRARTLSDKLLELSKDAITDIDSVYVSNESTFSNIFIGDILLSTITDIEAGILGTSHEELAEQRAILIVQAVKEYKERTSLRHIIMGLIFTAIATIVLFVILKLFSKYYPILYTKISDFKGTYIRRMAFQNLEILSEERAVRIVINFFRLTRFVLTVVLFYIYFPLVLGFFSWTRRFSGQLVEYSLNPVIKIWNGFVEYLPDLFFIIVAIVIARFVIKFVKFLFREVENENVKIPGFYSEWSKPTYKITRFFIIIATAIIIFPYLPGSSSPAFQGISIFLGLLFSLGSTSVIANMVGGLVLTYMRPFKLGDFVKIADTEGNVVEKTILVTRVRTLKNVDITVPNAIVLSNHIINYSATSEREGLVLHTMVTIGYDVPWRKVHELLIKSANEVEDIMDKPEPFILQKSLDNFSVCYELNAFTHEANRMAVLYSKLHEKIQDNFSEAGIEIMSPIYNSIRDGNKAAIPDDYLPKNYNSPSFKIFPRMDDK